MVNDQLPEHYLAYLDGRTVTGVCFFWTYVELHFDDASEFRTYSKITVDAGDGVLEHPTEASRVALWKLIGQSVVSTADEPTRLVVGVGGTRIEVSKTAAWPDPEVADLVPAVDGRRDGVNMMEWLSVPRDDDG